MIKSYQFNDVTAGFSRVSRKWQFTVGAGTFTLLTALKGGAATAEKVANIISGSNKRTKGRGLDNLGRANIKVILDRAAV